MKENNKLKFFIFFLGILFSNSIISQNSLLEEIDYNNEDYKVIGSIAQSSNNKQNLIYKTNIRNYK